VSGISHPDRPESGHSGQGFVIWAVAGSVLAHALVIAAALLVVGSEPPKVDLAQKPVKARLLRLGKKRDEKLLPRLPSAQPPPAATKPVEVPGARPAPIVPKPAPSTSKATTVKEDQQRRSRLFDAFASTAAKPEELSGDPDGDPDGDSDTATEGERYFGLVLSLARRNYGITKTIPPQELIRLKAIVVLYIGSKGELLKDPEVQTSSGNAQFDQDVILALRKAAPFGPPPKELAKTLESVGVAIEATP
jgi:protein TonB